VAVPKEDNILSRDEAKRALEKCLEEGEVIPKTRRQLRSSLSSDEYRFIMLSDGKLIATRELRKRKREFSLARGKIVARWLLKYLEDAKGPRKRLEALTDFRQLRDFLKSAAVQNAWNEVRAIIPEDEGPRTVLNYQELVEAVDVLEPNIDSWFKSPEHKELAEALVEIKEDVNRDFTSAVGTANKELSRVDFEYGGNKWILEIERYNWALRARPIDEHKVLECPRCGASISGTKSLRVVWSPRNKSFLVKSAIMCEPCGLSFDDENSLIKEIPVMVSKSSSCSCGANLILKDHSFNYDAADGMLVFSALYVCENCPRKEPSEIIDVLGDVWEVWEEANAVVFDRGRMRGEKKTK